MFQLGAITDELSPNLEHALDMAGDFGIQHVELHTAWERTIEQWDDAQIAWMEEALNKRGLEVCCISSTVFLRCSLTENAEPIPRLPGFQSIAGGYQDHLKALDRCLEIARKLRAPLVRVFGFWREGPTIDETYIRAAERISLAAEMAASCGIKLALENCPHTYFDWGARVARLIEAIDSDWVGMLWDPCSGLRAGEPDYLSASDTIFRSLEQGPLLHVPLPHVPLLHVHAKDMVVDDQLKRGRKYVPVMQGQVNWVEIFSRLKCADYDGVVCLETHHNGPDGARETAATASFDGLLRAYRETFPEKEKM